MFERDEETDGEGIENGDKNKGQSIKCFSSTASEEQKKKYWAETAVLAQKK